MRSGPFLSLGSTSAGPIARYRSRIFVSVSRAFSGGTRTVRNGARCRPSTARGGSRHRRASTGRLGAAARAGAGTPGERSRNGVSRWHLDPGASEGRGRGEKGGTSTERDHREALGRSRGGFGTKACVIADGKGRAVAFALAPGQAHEAPLALGLIDALPDAPAWIVGDRGLSAHALRELIWAIGARPAITPAVVPKPPRERPSASRISRSVPDLPFEPRRPRTGGRGRWCRPGTSSQARPRAPGRSQTGAPTPRALPPG